MVTNDGYSIRSRIYVKECRRVQLMDARNVRKRRMYPFIGNRIRKLQISSAPAKAKSWEPAYSQARNQNEIGRQRVKIQRVTQAGRQSDGRLWWMVCRVRPSHLRRAIFVPSKWPARLTGVCTGHNWPA